MSGNFSFNWCCFTFGSFRSWNFQGEGFDDVSVASSDYATNYISVAEVANSRLDGFGIAGLLSQGSLSLLLTVSRKLRLYLHPSEKGQGIRGGITCGSRVGP